MLTFYSIHPDIRQPVKADTGALGRMPLAAFQYCEAMRTASSLGWYVFPPVEFSLLFDGAETFLADGGAWRSLRSEPLPPALEADWQATYEPTCGPCPSMLTEFTDSGIIQVFTGLFVTSSPGTWCHIRPLANIHTKSAYWCYEGIVETDVFAPMPLFVNVQLVRTDSEIYVPAELPLFQVSCIPKEVTTLNRQADMRSALDAEFPKDGLATTLRRQPGVSVPVGQYGVDVRRKRKQDG